MTLLLDTHAFLWWITNDPRLSSNAQALIRDKNNELYLSAASAWEIAVKHSIGKLPLPQPPESLIPQHMQLNRILPLPISVEHAFGVAALPRHHTDPFDRLLVAQALSEKIPLLSADMHLRAYPVQVLW